ncbi:MULTISPECIES: U32 family peptidase [unclassified Fibrobacter]|uniref:U32 family peptidase n=1 Tax=unclassified Fibrobacter TaxID=2634177 RepID=UPI000D6AA7F6|nr:MULTISPECIES: U32 family peptidase [unclassified Fibrobacter]PWJ61135.1 putative protease [Fibrobacter sp. UWR4]PZW65593.1 putative protease [Fibrobacter sp. UWR1]
MDVSKNNSPELLLPVGTRDMLEAAVKNGANAVYFGVPYWNARGRTEDFSMDDVRDMIRYARIHGVRTYLAMNVLVFERELQNLPEYLEKIISFEPDGFIIQDIGLARLIRAISPTQEIHASTQMTLASAEGVNLVKSIGFNRAVLSRELSAKQIAEVKKGTDLEIEVFVHGALCVSYSGQCLTSENFGGRSANRGQCAQSCRLTYSIYVDGKEYRDTNAMYLFSTHDLCALPKLEELTQIGVESLKVEGRLKSPEYVAAVTRAYRKALDNSVADLNAKDLEPLEVLFSRGLTTGWLDGDNHQELVDGTFSNHHGLYLGRVAKVERSSVFVELSDKFISDFMDEGLPYPGDGILIEDNNFGVSLGSRLYSAEIVKNAHNKRGDGMRGLGPLLRLDFGRDFDTRKIAKGMDVFRNDSPALEKELRKTFTDRTLEVKTPINMSLEGSVGNPLKLKVWMPKYAVEVRSETVLEQAKNAGDIEGLARKELGGLSSTAYELGYLEVALQGTPFVPGKVLRTMRQQAVQKLDEARLAWHDLKINASRGKQFLQDISAKHAPAKAERPEISVLVRNPQQISALKGLDIDNVIMDFDWGVKYDEPLEQIRDLGFKAGMATLRIHKPGENHYLKKILELCPDFALVRNLGSISILKDSGIPLKGDYSLNAANSASYDWLLSQGLDTLHPSWDLNSVQLFDLLKNIDGRRLELTLHQYMPAFHSEYCAFARGLTTGRRFPECGKICTQHKVEILDHKGEKHFLQSDAECRNTLFVGRPQSALKLLPQLRTSGVHHFRLEMLQEDAETVRQKVLIYTQAIRGKISIDDAIRQAGIQEKYGLSEGQLFNDSTWQDRKK